MSEGFNVNEYWLKRGRGYIEEALPQDYHRLQEKLLVDLLRASQLPANKILEIGCGFGRITKLLADNFPETQIMALDLSPDQLANARRYCGDRKNIVFGQYDFYSDLPFPGSDYDVAIAIEVFLHHPRPMVRNIIEKLSGISRCILNIDWSEEWPWKTPKHVWVHDYGGVYKDAGLQAAGFALPCKIDGMQQKLFIAVKSMTPELIELREQIECTASPDEPVGETATVSGAAHWAEQLQRARAEILETVPVGSAFILVNDDQWGDDSKFADRRVMPFVEREGRYWGPPESDEIAIHELERLRQAGASHIVFAWTSSWWLKYYTGLRNHLNNNFPCVLENERLVVFSLKT
jgi:SAM-dependent methyltransferase